MKRRTFIQIPLAGLVSGLTVRFPGVQAAQSPTILEQIRHHRADCDWVPLIVGLGSRGRQLAAELDAVLHPEQEALIYADQGIMPTSVQMQVERNVPDLLENNLSCVLLFALDEPAIWPSALAWADQMRKQDVYLKVAVVCVEDVETALAHPLTQQLRNVLDAVIIQPDTRSPVIPRGFHPAIQSARMFLTEPSLIGFDMADLHQIFHASTVSIATSSLTLPIGAGGHPGNGVDACFDQLGGRKISGVVVRWTDGLHITMYDFDAICQRLEQRLGADDVVAGVITGIDPDLPEGEPGILHTIWTLSA